MTDTRLKESPAVTTESLLREVIDRNAVARLPQPEFRLKQQSSCNRASVSPDDPVGWFNSKDHNTTDADRNSVRVAENDGRTEWVLMDEEGPGAIVRIWMPWPGQAKPATNAIIRFYLDGASEPALEGNMLDLLNGKGQQVMRESERVATAE